MYNKCYSGMIKDDPMNTCGSASQWVLIVTRENIFHFDERIPQLHVVSAQFWWMESPQFKYLSISNAFVTFFSTYVWKLHMWDVH